MKQRESDTNNKLWIAAKLSQAERDILSSRNAPPQPTQEQAMKQTEQTTAQQIAAALADCRRAAEEQGAEPVEPEDYRYEAADLEYVEQQLGRKPTAEEWREAGLVWVGSNHIGEQDADEPDAEPAIPDRLATCETLDQLHDTLTEIQSEIDAMEQGSVEREDADAEMERAMVDLPTFGGADISGTSEVWSWDATRVLRGTCVSDLRIEARQDDEPALPEIEIDGDDWMIPPVAQGQIVECAYCASSDGQHMVRRTTDRSDNSVSYDCAPMADDFDPINDEPEAEWTDCRVVEADDAQ